MYSTYSEDGVPPCMLTVILILYIYFFFLNYEIKKHFVFVVSNKIRTQTLSHVYPKETRLVHDKSIHFQSHTWTIHMLF